MSNSKPHICAECKNFVDREIIKKMTERGIMNQLVDLRNPVCKSPEFFEYDLVRGGHKVLTCFEIRGSKLMKCPCYEPKEAA